MNILIINAYSYKNRGDSGIIVATIKLLREIFPNCKIDIMSNFYKENINFYKNYDVNSIEPIWNNTKRGMIKNYIKGLIFALKVMTLPTLIPLRKKNNLKKYDLVISAGGGYLYSSKKGPLGYGLMNSLFNMLYFKNHNIPVILFPQSVGPFNYEIDKKVVSRVLNKIDLVMSREPISTNLLKEIGVEKNIIEIPDIAFILEPKKISLDFLYNLLGNNYNNYFKIGITVMDWLFARKGKTEKDINNYLDKIAYSLKEIKHKFNNLKVYIFPQVDVGDKDTDLYVSKQFLNKLLADNISAKLVSLENIYDPEITVSIYSQMDVFIASRMHSSIFALAGGVPTIAFAYQPKTLGTFKLLGLDDFVLDIEEFSSEEFVQLFELLLFHKKLEFEESLYLIKKEIKNKIKYKILK
jgi:colanic acid/amylovoran biosynthesis protein